MRYPPRVAARIERRHGDDFVPRQRAPIETGQCLEQPLARTAGCIDGRLRHGSVGVLVNCRQECNRAFEFLRAQLHQAPAPDARALTRPLGPVFGQEEVDFEHADRGVAGRVALRPAKRLPGAGTVAAVHTDRGHALKGSGAQLGPGRFPDDPLKQPLLFPSPARIVVQVAEQRQSIIVLVSRAGELVAEVRLQETDGLSGMAHVPGFLGRNDQAFDGHAPGRDDLLAISPRQRIEHGRPEFGRTHGRQRWKASAAAFVFHARAAVARLVAARLRQRLRPEIVMRRGRRSPERTAELRSENPGLACIHRCARQQALPIHLGAEPGEKIVKIVRHDDSPDGGLDKVAKRIVRQKSLVHRHASRFGGRYQVAKYMRYCEAVASPAIHDQSVASMAAVAVSACIASSMIRPTSSLAAGRSSIRSSPSPA